ncbi:hypothetical protein OG795_00060 [[Kitasatospora] papulosa]|uniref:hypothetical protein n=1 Tax=[Kitasatospora] papulosa TaxID=1464011 RepID=UPI0032440522
MHRTAVRAGDKSVCGPCRTSPARRPPKPPASPMVEGTTFAVWANTLPRLKRGEPWYEIGVDDPGRRRGRYPEPAGR